MENKQTYTYEEAYGVSLQYFGGDELAARVWVNKYAMKDGFGNIFEKSPEQMHWRIANEIARIEKKYPNPLSAQQVFDVQRAGWDTSSQYGQSRWQYANASAPGFSQRYCRSRPS